VPCVRRRRKALAAVARLRLRHSPRLKLAVLNVSAMSDARSDVRTPDGTGDCTGFCWPGLPHAWAEMLLRVVEQSRYGASDGLH
jgi:hypothetical protein